MYKARYYKQDGKKGRARQLPDALFDGVVNESVLHQAVKVYLANQRQGTAAARNRAAVAGGSRKPWRQKGTGRARQGTTRAAQWTGGGVAFPPVPHGWRQRLPRKVRALARRSALNDRAEKDSVVLVDLPPFEVPKTRDMVRFLSAVGAEGKVLLLTDGVAGNVVLSARNVPGLEVRAFGTESVYDLLWAGTVLIERSALDGVAAAAPAAEEAATDAPAAAAVAEDEAAAPSDADAEAATSDDAAAGAEEGDDA